mmetsp:Transcript_27147/g.68886  ORF Transcript_27147/g.68886 Transcript_27147/m.68886 type:complete len:232 (-) Transcript_27147:128-823(-)
MASEAQPVKSPPSGSSIRAPMPSTSFPFSAARTVAISDTTTSSSACASLSSRSACTSRCSLSVCSPSKSSRLCSGFSTVLLSCGRSSRMEPMHSATSSSLPRSDPAESPVSVSHRRTSPSSPQLAIMFPSNDMRTVAILPLWPLKTIGGLPCPTRNSLTVPSQLPLTTRPPLADTATDETVSDKEKDMVGCRRMPFISPVLTDQNFIVESWLQLNSVSPSAANAQPATTAE